MTTPGLVLSTFCVRSLKFLDKFKEFEAMVTNDLGDKIVIHISGEFNSYLKSKGIRHELTIPHTPQQNGVAERMKELDPD